MRGGVLWKDSVMEQGNVLFPPSFYFVKYLTFTKSPPFIKDTFKVPGAAVFALSTYQGGNHKQTHDMIQLLYSGMRIMYAKCPAHRLSTEEPLSSPGSSVGVQGSCTELHSVLEGA